MKTASASVAVMAMAVVMATAEMAGAWALHCQNGSCTASSGKLQITYETRNMMDIERNIILRGVEGLPFSTEDFMSEEKKLDQTFEKTISRDSKGNANIDASGSGGGDGGAGGGGKIGVDHSSGIGLTRKQSQGVSNTEGGKVTVNYTLMFFKHYADTGSCKRYPANSFSRFGCAAEDLMNDYMSSGGDKTREAMSEFLFDRKAPATMPAVKIETKTSPQNNELQTVKYAALSQFPTLGDQRWARAYRYVQDQASNDKTADIFNQKFFNDKTSLDLMLKPGQTANKLDAAGKHAEAMAKWAADTSYIHFDDPVFAGIKSMPDKYMTAIGFANNAPEDVRKSMTADFEKAKAAKDAKLDLVTVKANYGKLIGYTLGLAAILSTIGSLVFYLRKRKALPAPFAAAVPVAE